MEIIIRSYDIYYFDIFIIDEIDKVILSSLSKNARIPAADIANNLKSMFYRYNIL